MKACCDHRSAARIQMKKLLFLFVLLATLPAGCTVRMTQPKPPPPIGGTLIVYLQPLPQETHRLTFTIAHLAARRADDTLFSLLEGPAVLRGSDLIGIQKKLLTAALPPGDYNALVLRLTGATLLAEEGETALLSPSEPIHIDHRFSVKRNQAKTLFLDLSPERLITDGFNFTPRFSVWQPERQLINLKGFICDTEANSISVFNKEKPEIIGTIATGRSPKGMALDQEREWLYVALAEDDVIDVIEVNNGKILGRVKLRSGDRPLDLALTPDGKTLVSINSGSNTASIIDTVSLFERSRINFSSDPVSVFMDISGTRAYVLHPMFNSLSVIGISSYQQKISVVLDEAPAQGDVSSDGKELYITTAFSPNLLVINAANLAITGRIYIGVGMLSVEVDAKTGLVYIGNKSGEISIVDPSQGIVIDSFELNGPVAHMTIDNEDNTLFALLPDNSEVQKIDLVSKKLLGVLNVGKGVSSVAVMGEK